MAKQQIKLTNGDKSFIIEKGEELYVGIQIKYIGSFTMQLTRENVKQLKEFLKDNKVGEWE